MNSKAKRTKKKIDKLRYSKGTFSVVKFLEEYAKLFECIPDLWFYNEDKTMCYWPSKSKKSVTLRAMSQDEPEDDWTVYQCELVSEGHGKIWQIMSHYPSSIREFFSLQPHTRSVVISQERRLLRNTIRVALTNI